MIKDVCFNDRNAVLGICDFDAKIVILRSKPARSQKLRSGLEASLLRLAIASFIIHYWS